MKLISKLIRVFSKVFFYLGVLVFSWVLCLYLRSDIVAPRSGASSLEWQKAKSQSKWFSKEKYGLNHIFLHGSPFERGLAWGSLTGDLLKKQEDILISLYTHIIHSPVKRKLFETGLMAVFEGLDEKLEPAMLEEMWGVAQSSTHDYNFLASPYARQIAYHGIHEVGQMFVDFSPVAGACTFLSYPQENGKWIVGRTFDFEGGRIFDEEKVLKWVYPETGHKYLSVIWTGMVGAVSGVNDQGIYVSINAAGSTDINLRGLPSTLLVSKVLQEASNIEEALAVFRDNDIMITDIFMVLDSKSGRLFRVEKSALHLDMTEIKEATAVTNHLISKDFENDEFNRIRRDNFTSQSRGKRAQSLLDSLKVKAPKAREVPAALLSILRDKGVDEKGHPLHLGNRSAVDALIASHGVIYDSQRSVLFVSVGPSLVGEFKGFDLAKSFESEKPVEVETLKADTALSLAQYKEIQEKLSQLKTVSGLLEDRKCLEAESKLKSLEFMHVDYYLMLHLTELCLAKNEEAKEAARRALELMPPHKDVVDYLKEFLK